MNKIVIGKCGSKSVSFDLDVLLRTRLLVQANSGGGKSWLLRRLAEQLFGKVQVIILDREGEFATLREQFGYVLVGKGGETPADCRSAELVARKLLELRASAVCDLYEMKDHERHRWVRLFLEALVDAPKNLWHDVVIIVDEIHSFAPEKGSGESEASDAVIGLATRGRKRGFCLVGATQRLGKFRKDAAAELLNVLIGMTFIDVDRKRAAEALGIPRSEEREFSDKIKMLEPGTFYALGRAVSKERLLTQIGSVETTHPEPGSSKHAAGPPPTPGKVKALLPKLADLPKEAEAKAKSEAELRTEIRSLKAQLVAKPNVVTKAQVTTVETPVVLAKDIAKVEKSIARIGVRVDELRECALKLGQAVGAARAPRPVQSVSAPPVQRKVALIMGANQFPIYDSVRSVGPVPIGKLERSILTVLAQNPDGCDMGRLALLSGYKVSGGFRNALSALRTEGYLSGGNGETMRITESGQAAIVGQWGPVPSGAELVNYWLTHRSFGKCEREILKSALTFPDGATMQQLADTSGYVVSGGFRNSLSSLRTAGVLVGKNSGNMKPCEELLQAVTVG